MHSRIVRVMLLALLVAVGIGAAFQVSFLIRQGRQLEEDQRSLSTQLARFDALAGDLFSAQVAYVAPGQADAPWMARVDEIAPRLTATVSDIRLLATSQASATLVRLMTEALSAWSAADANARAALRQEQDLLAADTIFGEARPALDGARAAAVQLAAAERESFSRTRADIDNRLLWVIGGTAGVWVIGLLALTPRPRRVAAPEPELTNLARAVPDAPSAPPTRPTTVKPMVDLAEAADLCSALSRVVSATAIPDMLARTAAILDASGVIVWMGAGDELYAATSHGYNPKVISRLGSIPRNADNPTAEAWRTGELRTVAGDAMSNGAIVAPMFSPDGCIGVLAAEIRHGREQDSSTQAVTIMIAAQLAAVVGAWPAAPQTTKAAEA